MRTILFLLQKEFTQIFRNKTMLPMIFIIPIIQLVVLVHATTFEIKNIQIYVMDNDISSTSRKLISKFESSPFFEITGYSFSQDEANQALLSNEADIVLCIPQNFERDLVRNNSAKIQLLLNAINGSVAGIANAYASQIIMNFNQNLVAEWLNVPKENVQNSSISINYSYWYNPELNYKTYMVPGILVLLVTVIGMFLSSMNLVREKELGTIEQINVTPIKKYQFIIGKLLPFWVIALFELAFGLVIGKVLFNIPMVGSLWLVFLSAGVYLLVVLGIGLLVSTFTETQQQAMFISWFFLLVFILMSGLFTSVESMPNWAQIINKGNPIAYFIHIIRMIMLKGSTISDIKVELLTLSGLAVIMLSLSVWKYKKVA